MDNFYGKWKLARDYSLANFFYRWANALISSSDMDESQRTLTSTASTCKNPGTVGIP